MLVGMEFDSYQVRHKAGTAAKVMDSASADAPRTASGKGLSSRITGIPCSSNGSTKLEKPYECAREMTARLGQAGRNPIVVTIFAASAASCCPPNVINRETPVVAEVIL